MVWTEFHPLGLSPSHCKSAECTCRPIRHGITGDQKVDTSSRKSSAVETHRPGSLKSYIVRVLSEAARPLGPREIGLKVRRAGYRTKAKDLTRAVTNALPELKNVKRVGYGQYGLVGWPKIGFVYE